MKSLSLLLYCAFLLSAVADDSNYTLTDPELKAVVIDSDPKESFFGMQCDSAGRLFVGAREGLFVYEPDPNGLYQPRKLLFRFPANSWIGDIAIRGNDLYVATHNAVYLLAGAVTNRDGLKPKRLLWGLPPLAFFQEHQGFHGLVFGPESDLYVSFGDNLIGYGDFKRPDHFGHWTFYHGENTTPFTGCGGVLRVSPDGNQLSVIATGLRNPCGLAFDSDWNLFSNDNDHESRPDEYVPGRLLHITPHADFAWPRGWLIEKQPWRADLLDTLNPNLGRYVPAGQGYYNDAFLPEKFRRCLYVAEWGKAMLLRYPLRADGASFKADECQFLAGKNKARPVGVTVGRGGRIFVTTLYMAANEASPVVKSDLVMITLADDAPNAPFDAWNETTATDTQLVAASQNASWSRRYRAHIELSRRGKVIPPKAQDYATLEKNLASTNARAAHAALIDILDRGDQFPYDAVLALARSQDSYLRQTAVQILAQKATTDQLQKLSGAPAAADRLVGVLALGRRLTVPPVTQPLPDDYPAAAPNFASTVQYADGTVELKTLGRLANFTMAEVWARKKTKSAEEEKIFDFLQRRLHDADEQVAKQAAFNLRLLADPRTDAEAAAILKIKNDVIVKPIASARPPPPQNCRRNTGTRIGMRKPSWAAPMKAVNSSKPSAAPIATPSNPPTPVAADPVWPMRANASPPNTSPNPSSFPTKSSPPPSAGPP